MALAACGERGAATPGSPSTATAPPAAADGLVLRVEYTGGFVSPSVTAGRLPLVSVYADGRVISEGPVIAIYPGPALPNLQVQQIGRPAVRDLVDRALAAGVGETTDLGMPLVADAPSTRFTLVTDGATYQREVYALGETPEDSGLTAAQDEARGRLSDLLSSIPEANGVDTSPYAAKSVAAVVTPWIDPEDGLVHPSRAVARTAAGRRTRRRTCRRHVHDGDRTTEAQALVEAARTGQRRHPLGHRRRAALVGHVPPAAARRVVLRRPAGLRTTTGPAPREEDRAGRAAGIRR